jgi:tetratricopeptide (TPR) repeat protein
VADERDVTPRFVLLTVLLLATPALAAAQAPTDAELAEAQRQFELGVTEYQAGELADALVRFSRAHALSHAPELLYNIATVHERLRHDAEALDAYESYLAAVPESDDREAIEARVRVLRAELAPAPAPTLDVVVAPAPAPEAAPPVAMVDAPASGSDPAPWILTGTGLAVAAGGGVLVALGAMDASTVGTTTSWAEAEAARDRAPVLSGTGFGAIGVGAVTAVIGLVWGATASSGTTRVAVGPGSLSISGTF